MDCKKQLRCACYTRKSHENGLELEFNSLDAQRDAVENYIKSQKDNGWVLLPKHYDDGGFTGGNMERPALKQLMEEIAEGKIDCVVVYKIDRLSRSLIDFSKIMEIFNQHGVNFVSVTQQFSTVDSSGRMMLNILMTFSQYEREIISDRLRDRVAGAKRRGKYCGGSPVIGYDADIESKKLVINEPEAEIVRHIFERYPELGSAKKLAAELNGKGFVTKKWTSVKGRDHGGKPWNTANIYRTLNNPLYIGKVTHHDKTFPGEHEAIVSRKKWDTVHQLFKAGGLGKKRNRIPKKLDAPLSGLIRCGHCGGAMTPTYSTKNKRRYTYFFCQKDSKRAVSVCPIKRIPGGDIQKVVLQQLSAVFQAPTIMAKTIMIAREAEQKERDVLLAEKTELDAKIKNVREKMLTSDNSDASEKSELIKNATALARECNQVADQLAKLEKASIKESDVADALANIESLWEMLFPAEQYRMMHLMIESVSIFEDSINILLKTDAIPSLIVELTGMELSSSKKRGKVTQPSSIVPEVLPEGKIMLKVPAYFKYQNGRKLIVTPETLEGENSDSPDVVQYPIIRAIGKAHQWKAMLESGEVASISDLSRTLEFSHSYIIRILSLTTLAPDIVEAIINGEEPSGLSLEKLVSGFPEDWEEQRKQLIFRRI
jgi:site-specific DNA recombinase